jgi:hypothetical protein
MRSKTPDPMAVEEVAIRAAMGRRLDELKSSAVALADPRPWIKYRPLTACLAAAGAGLTLGLLAGGRKPAPRRPATDADHAATQHKEHQTLGAMLAAGLVPTLQPMISDLIHTAMGSRPAGADKAADVTEQSISSGLAEDNKVVD